MNYCMELADGYAYDKGFAQKTYLLECIRMGRYNEIDEELSSPELLEQMEKIFGNDISFASMVFQFIWPQAQHAAVEGGLPEMVASGIYNKYFYDLQHVKSVCVLIEMNKRIFIEYANKVASFGTDAHLSPVVRMCHMYINTHINEKLTINHIAQDLHYSRSYLAHVYKRETGETISDRIQNRKIAEAMILLRYSSLSLIDIGYKLGFCSQSHFSEIFRKVTGMTPNRYSSIYREEQHSPKRQTMKYSKENQA